MSGETFGHMLRRLRGARTATVCYRRGTELVAMTGPMSQNELARQAGVDTALVHRLEIGQRRRPKRATALKLAEALDLDAADTARLLIAAGYWPWADADIERVIRFLADETDAVELTLIRRSTG